MSDSKENNELKFQIAPDTKLIFDLESDLNTPISVAGGDNGKIKINGTKIEYTPNPGFSGTEKLNCEYIKGTKKTRTIVYIKVVYSFRAKSHILTLLGDELIGSDNLAVFELVKNAYDADAQEVTITLNDLNTSKQSITVEDDGHGMTLDTLKSIWLEIGTDSKRGENRKPSKKYNRISLGEKGVGRLAVHKLGKSIVLETQSEGSKVSHRISLNWQKVIDESEYIQDAGVEIQTVEKSLFKKGKGTRIIISDLKKEHWARKDLRELARKTNSIKSPFRKIDHFDVIIKANDHHNEWIEDIKNIDDLLKDSIYCFEFSLVEDTSSEFVKITWNYKFNPPESFGIKPNQSSLEDFKTGTKNTFAIKANSELFGEGQKHLKNKDLEGIGNINGKFYVYNLSPAVLNAFGQTNAIRAFVKENSGVRIFRDGIRVYNYGEPNDDWLGLDLARVQKLGEHFSKNTVIGAVEIGLKNSHKGLKEKTNREGFDENEYYAKFKTVCNEVFDVFERIALPDRDLIKTHLEGIKPIKRVGFSDTIAELEDKLKEKKIDKELSPLLRRVEKDYNDMRDVMLNSGMTGINLGIVFHEVDREVRFINADLKNNVEIDNIKIRMKNLIQLLENFSPILKQNKKVKLSALQLIERAKQINNPRFGYHQVIFSSPLLSKESEDFEINGPGNLLISAVSNLIDNAIYWVSDKKEIAADVSYKPAIFIGSDVTGFSGPAIIIADNGSGFNLSPEDLVLPYRSTRPGGMGLGLYFVNMVMGMIGGKLLFPDKSEVKIPGVYDGAIVALVFPKK